MWKADPAPPLRPGVQSDSSYVFLIPSNHGVQETVLEEGPTFWSEELICFVLLSKSLPLRAASVSAYDSGGGNG